MKKLLLFLIAGLFIANSGFSQISKSMAIKTLNKNNEILQQLKDYSKSDAYFEVIGKICGEGWNVDSLNNLVQNQNVKITFENLGNDKYKATYDNIQTDDSGQSKEIIAETYFSGDLPDYNIDPNVDSIIISTTLGGINIPVVWQRYYYDAEKLDHSVSYLNYSALGVPLGILLSDSTQYYYDNKNFLVGESHYGLSFNDFTSIIISDSIAYTNNAKGFETESIHYQPGSDGILTPTGRNTYEYDSQDRVIKEKEYVNPDNWILSTRTTTDYKSKLTIELREITNDAGTTWEPTNLDSTFFNVDLPYGFPNKTANYEYENGEWKIISYILYKDCSGTATNNVEYSSFAARFDNDDIVILADQTINDANVTLYNTNGQVLFNQRFKIVPEKIFAGNLLSGIYILKINGTDFKGVGKVIKF